MAKKAKEPVASSPFKMVVQNLKFHNFEEEKTLIAMYKDTVTLGDEEDPEKTFQANVFVDINTGEEKYVQDSYSIHKAIQEAKREYRDHPTGLIGLVFSIEFLGKTQLKGKPFNQFKIGYCTEEAWDAFNV